MVIGPWRICCIVFFFFPLMDSQLYSELRMDNLVGWPRSGPRRGEAWLGPVGADLWWRAALVGKKLSCEKKIKREGKRVKKSYTAVQSRTC
ncbi:hypothetical protein BS78_10G114200 [Paspalum vaginatum]|nr:hypothetical protein BS78_10G114200 [Paspalum vaginatum]